MPLEKYQVQKVPILNQGRKRACSGFGRATAAHFLAVVPDERKISPRMFYIMTRRYDGFPGECYEGACARGAMKSWHKHGVCSKELWPYEAGKEDNKLTHDRAVDAMSRPLGAYFRVNHRDLVALHCAIAYDTPLLGLEKHINEDDELSALFMSGSADWVKAPNKARKGSIWSSQSSRHGDFDDDEATQHLMLVRILAVDQNGMGFEFSRSTSSLSDRRKMLEAV